MKLPKFIRKRVLPRLASLVVNGLMRTTRLKVVNRETPDYFMANRDKTAIFCFWHGKIIPLYHTYRRKGIYILISQHRDGELIARMVECNGYKPVRGSSTRGGSRSVKEMLKIAREGNIITITPDGPKGPKQKLKEGAVFLAQMTGAPLYPIGIGLSKCWQARDWSGIQIPKPFSRTVIYFGREFRVPRKIEPEEFERYRREIEAEIVRCNEEARRIACGEQNA